MENNFKERSSCKVTYFDSSGSSENPSPQAKKLNRTGGTNFFTLATLISAATGGQSKEEKESLKVEEQVDKNNKTERETSKGHCTATGTVGQELVCV